MIKKSKTQNRIATMIREMVTSGITYEEIAVEISCSRTTLMNWMAGVYKPTSENLKQVADVYKKFASRLHEPEPSAMLQKILDSGLSRDGICDTVGCSMGSLKNWLHRRTKPIGKYHKALRDLYFDKAA